MPNGNLIFHVRIQNYPPSFISNEVRDVSITYIRDYKHTTRSQTLDRCNAAALNLNKQLIHRLSALVNSTIHCTRTEHAQAYLSN